MEFYTPKCFCNPSIGKYSSREITICMFMGKQAATVSDADDGEK